MKLKINILFLVLFVFKSAYCQEIQKAPLNEEFVKFISRKSKTTGVIPAPTIYVFSNEINKDNTKFSYPESYDLRDEGLVTPVKDQGSAGHCWSFATIGAIESRNLKLGLGEYDLSEHNLATCHGFESDEGGSRDIATAYLSRLSGPVLETEDPYDPYDFNCSATGITPQFYVPEAHFLPSNPDVIKYILMNYGGIYVSYYHSSTYFNSSNNTYYYTGTEYSNHAVLLVGWDDTKTTDGGTGAWILKNSWGSSWGESGFFYMSYNDSHAIKNPTIFPIRKETNNIDTVLMYDNFGDISSYGYADYEAFALIKHHVSEEYSFNKIGTYISASNSIVDIEVFSTKDDNVLSDTLAKAYDLFVEYPGYHTFDVPFIANGDFYIKMKYNTPNNNFPIPVEMGMSEYVYPQIESNVGWVSIDGDSWNSIGAGTNTEADLCIRAYGTKSDIKASFTSDYETICNDSEVTFTSNSSGDITNCYWDFGKDASPATASTEGPHSVTYLSEGFKTIKLVVENSSGTKDSIVNYNFINVNSEINLNIAPGDSLFVIEGDTIELNVFGAHSYIWYPSELLIGDTTSTSVKISTDTEVTIYVDGTMNSCTSTDSVIIKIKNIPVNDDICNAVELTLDEESGPFTNAYATVQSNEPHPVEGDCSTAMEWCVEGGLHNSIWFTFIAPNSGAVNIETDGFDNQIAVYDAENCNDIISGNEELFELIAANDDWQDSDYSATIEEITGLTSGKTYWLQMDGSAGGDEGECTITISTITAEHDSPCNAKSLEFLTNYSENNNYATIDINEPMPDNTDCSAQNSWCPDDTLNATVWYKFAATSSGVVSIESTGFDNQIAVYSASDCADLLSGDPADYTILAANDNYEGSNAASIYSITGLTEGTDYWIQVDGKNSEFNGTFNIILKEWPLSIEDISHVEEIIKVFPNPSNGEFKIDLSSIINNDKSENLSIEVISTDGSVVYKYEGIMSQKEHAISIDKEGLFIVRIIFDNNQYSTHIVIE